MSEEQTPPATPEAAPQPELTLSPEEQAKIQFDAQQTARIELFRAEYRKLSNKHLLDFGAILDVGVGGILPKMIIVPINK